MTTTIHSNGSKWAGQEPDSLEVLLDLLAHEPLDPDFEKYGDFATKTGLATVMFWGNFFHISHVFRIESDDDDVCTKLFAAIRANKASAAYKEARDLRFQGPTEVKAAARTAAHKRKYGDMFNQNDR